ncbi:acyl-CoA thioesterase [Paracholeplasma manati]|uniref:acyl-CoA thioesterase n=1 Tax=Paracholeplasma manati TaxID=591373 RepID=UPI0024079B91|nr:thioesterase family protein [Paracholeplasma manati]MDG0889508.1 thioesterase family protein [Paracholeplasma manati]
MITDKLKLEAFPYQTHDKVRYGDTDRQGHVNNIHFSEFLETGRVEILYRPEQPLHGEQCSFVIVQNNLSLLNEIHWPGVVYIGTGVVKLGKSSITFYQQLFQNDVVVAVAETVIVQVNNITHQSTPLNEHARAVLDKLIINH